MRLLIFSGAILLLTAGVYAWLRPKSAAPVPPEIPASVADADVRVALTRARDKVMAGRASGQAWGDLGLTFRAHALNAESNACFQQAAALDPANPRWPYLIGVMNLLIAPDDAVPQLRAAHHLAVEPEHRSLTRLRLAEALLERGDVDEAAALFAEEAKANPLNARAQFGLGVAAAARGDHKVAVVYLTLAADSPYARRKAATLLAASHRRSGNAADAERIEREAAGRPDDLPWPDPFLGEYGRRETGRGARMKAVEELEANGRLREAVAELEDIVQSSPDDQALVSLGINQAKLGDYAKAERTLRVVAARSPDHAVARYFLGIALHMQAERVWRAGDRARAEPRFKEAVTELRAAAKLKPDKGMANLYAGLALKYLGDLPAAEAECRAAVRASPQFADVHLGLAEVLIAMGKSAEARPHLETAARLSSPADTRANVLLETIRGKHP